MKLSLQSVTSSPERKSPLSKEKTQFNSTKHSTTFYLLQHLRTAEEKNLLSRIHYFVQQVSLYSLSESLAQPRLDALWYELLEKHSLLLRGHQLLPLAQQTQNPFQQVMGLYYYAMSGSNDNPFIKLTWRAVKCGNVDAAKTLTQYYGVRIVDNNFPPEHFDKVLISARKYFPDLQALGYLFLGHLFKTIGAYYIRQPSKENQDQGWGMLKQCIFSFYQADRLSSTPNSVIILQNAYRVRTLEEVWQSKESPLYLGIHGQRYLTFVSYIDNLTTLYGKSGYSMGKVIAEAKRLSEEALVKYSLVPRATSPMVSLSQADLLQLTATIFSPAMTMPSILGENVKEEKNIMQKQPLRDGSEELLLVSDIQRKSREDY